MGHFKVAATALATIGLLLPAGDALARAGSGSSSSHGSSGSGGSSRSHGSSHFGGTGGVGGSRIRHLHPLPGGGYADDYGPSGGYGSTGTPANVTPSNVTIPKVSSGTNWGLILGLGLGLGIPAIIGVVALGAARKGRSEKLE